MTIASENPIDIDAKTDPKGFITRHRLPAVLDWERTQGRCSCVDRAVGAGIFGIALGSFFFLSLSMLAILNPQPLLQPKGVFTTVITFVLLVGGVLYARGSFYCSIVANEITLGRKTFFERWAVTSPIKQAIVRIRTGDLYVGNFPKPGYFVVTIECSGRWMVVGVTRSEAEARQCATKVGIYGVPVELETRGVFRGFANL